MSPAAFQPYFLISLDNVVELLIPQESICEGKIRLELYDVREDRESQSIRK